MLHILWLIIKFILILLAIVLGLILLILLLVLFCPVRYKASIRKEPASLKKFKERCRRENQLAFWACNFKMQISARTVLERILFVRYSCI